MRSTLRSARVAVAVAVSVAGILGFAASAASAATCTSGFTCAWKDANALGNRCQFSGNNGNWALFNGTAGTTCDNMASSFFNNGTTSHFRYYDGYSQTGVYDCVLKGQYQPTVQGFMNDKTSSNLWFSPPTPC